MFIHEDVADACSFLTSQWLRMQYLSTYSVSQCLKGRLVIPSAARAGPEDGGSFLTRSQSFWCYGQHSLYSVRPGRGTVRLIPANLVLYVPGGGIFVYAKQQCRDHTRRVCLSKHVII